MTAVLSDVDGGVHVAVVLVDDPAADLHDWYGRYLYFAPDELEPLPRPDLIQRGEPAMNTLGKITTALLIAMAVGAVVVTVLSIPDIKRYFKIRSM